MSYSIKGSKNTLWSEHGDPHEILIRAKGESYRKYREQWEWTLKLEGLTDMPTQLEMELNPSCNYKCPFCPWSAQENHGEGREGWMPFEKYKEIIDEVAGKVQSISLNYINEPLVRQDMPEFVAYAADKGLPEIMFNSNGFLLSEDMSRKLIDAGLTKLSISIDAVTPETYDKIRIGGDYNKVINNINNFLKIREEKGRDYPLLKTTFVVNKINKHELKDFVKKWKGVSNLFSIQGLINPFDGEKGKEIENLLGDPTAVGKDNMEACGTDRSEDKRCQHPFQRLAIRSNGQVLPCCNFRGVDLIVGNIYEQTIAEIWHGEPMQKLREIHLAGRYYENEICKACMDNWSEAAPDPSIWSKK